MKRTQKKPEWLNKRLNYRSMREMGLMLRSLNLNSVCEGAKCPNMGECFANKTATFMILGDVCSRNCRFCAVSSGKMSPPDPAEPENILIASRKLGLKHIVITSVTRDDLPDGGAYQFAECIYKIKKNMPEVSIEVLIPDMKGDQHSLNLILKAKPDILNHNLETVPGLYNEVRPMADYHLSLAVLEYFKTQDPSIYTKSGIMVGLGEKKEEIIKLFDDLRQIDCDMLTIGQYLPPSHAHAELKEYVRPDVFDEYKSIALNKGFKYVASAPYVRSSYNAAEGMRIC